jgi:hypothetical protein
MLLDIVPIDRLDRASDWDAFHRPHSAGRELGIPVAIPRNRTVNQAPWPSSTRANRN